MPMIELTVPHGSLAKDRDGLMQFLRNGDGQLLLAAEGASTDDISAGMRVRVIIQEVADGNWGGAGRIWRLADIAGYVESS